MRLIRFVLARRHPDSGVEDGTFALAYELRDSAHVDAADRNLLAANLWRIRGYCADGMAREQFESCFMRPFRRHERR